MTNPPQLSFREVDKAHWRDFERLFESRGGPKYCWCMAWRAQGAKTGAKGSARKAAMKKQVGAGVPVGLLGYLHDEPVAWCSIAPRPTYRRLGGPEIAGERADDVWSLVCFFLRRDLRGQNLTSQLIDAAVTHARARGAKIVEAYPVDVGSPSYRFMGYVSAFEAAGFERVGRAGSRRHVMRRSLAGKSAPTRRVPVP